MLVAILPDAGRAVPARLPPSARRWLALIVLLGFLWRAPALFEPTIAPDEALFGLWARWIASGQDAFLLGQVVDKPPLAFYLQAASLKVFGDAATLALRVPSLLASLFILPLVGQLVWRLYGDALSAVLTASIIALSPLAIRYGASGYLESLWLALVLASATTMAAPASRRAASVSGFWFGLALLTKYQALFYLPLLLLTGWLLGWRHRRWLRWLIGLAPGVLLLLLWSFARPGLGIWSVQLANYGGLRLIHSWELWPRLVDWGEAWSLALGLPVILLALAMPLFLALLIQQENWETVLDQLILVALLGAFLAHWFVAVPLWERYVLLALPLAAILAGRLLVRLWRELPALVNPGAKPARYAGLFVLLVVAVQLPAAGRAGSLSSPPTAQIAAQLAGAPYGTVLYDHWYSWQWRYHFFGEGVYVSWFPSPDALVADLAVFAQTPGARYLALPQDPRANPVLRALRTAGYRLEPIWTTSTDGEAVGISLLRVWAP